MKDKTKRSFSFNIIDVLLILMIVAASVLLVKVIRDEQLESKEETKAPITFTLTVTPIREEFQGKAGIGERLRDAESGAVLGEIVNVTYNEASVLTYHPDTGEQILSPYPGYLTMTITLRAEADVSSGFYRVGDYELQLGRSVSFHLPGLSESATLTALEEEAPNKEAEVKA